MNITVNGKEHKLEETSNCLLDILVDHGFEPQHVVVILNENMVELVNYGDCHLQHGDKLEILSFVGGG